MKVLHIYKAYPPVVGGIEHHLRLLAEGQARPRRHGAGDLRLRPGWNTERKWRPCHSRPSLGQRRIYPAEPGPRGLGSAPHTRCHSPPLPVPTWRTGSSTLRSRNRDGRHLSQRCRSSAVAETLVRASPEAAAAQLEPDPGDQQAVLAEFDLSTARGGQLRGGAARDRP